MKELNIELWKLGRLAKTQYNEDAPSQLELAPIYGNLNVVIDHNQLNGLIKKIAQYLNMKCLLH